MELSTSNDEGGDKVRVIEIIRGHKWGKLTRFERGGWCRYLVCKDCGIKLHISILGEDKSIYLWNEDDEDTGAGVYCGFGNIDINLPKEYICRYRKMERALR